MLNKLAEFLKIKQVSLALEAKYIKQRMLKHKVPLSQSDAIEHRDIRDQLKNHLDTVVTVESRATNIARAYLRGEKYSFVEPRIKPNKFWAYTTNKGERHVSFFVPEDVLVWKRVSELVAKYENNGAYISKNLRRKYDEVYNEIIAWRNQHPQLKRKE